MNEQKYDYQAMINHVLRLPVLTMIVNNRGGSDFFESLLDGHEEILNFRGKWEFHRFWKESFYKDKDLEFLIDEFTMHPSYIRKFNGNYNVNERWNQLGEDKNESFSYNIIEFKQHVYNILKNQILNTKNFIIAVQIAYAIVTEQNIFKTRLAFYHLHSIRSLPPFIDDFPMSKVLLMTRHPLNGISSLVDGNVHATIYDALLPAFEFDQYNETRYCRVITLESLHSFPELILRSFCNEFDISFTQSLMHSTVHGKQWWGDQRTQSGSGWLKGFRSNVEQPRWHGKFFLWDILLLETILYEKMSAYKHKSKYRITRNNAFIYRFFGYTLAPLPMKYEIIALKNAIKSSKGLYRKINHFSYILYLYYKRVALYYTYLRKSARGLAVGKIYNLR